MFRVKIAGGKFFNALISMAIFGLASCNDNATDPVGTDSSSSTSTSTTQTQGDGNSTSATATSLQWSAPDTVNLSSNADVDWYRVVAPRGGVLKFTVEDLPLSTTSPSLYGKLYGENLSATAITATIPLDGTKHTVPAQVKPGDTVWIKLYTSTYGNPFPSTNFSIRADLDTSDNNEWNDLPSRATTITLDAAPTLMKLFPEGDVDWFKFTLAKNSIVQFRIDTGYSDSLIYQGQALRSSLLDAEGSPNCYGCFDLTSWMANTNVGRNTFRALKAGTYQIEATLASGSTQVDKPLRIQVRTDTADPQGWHNDKASASSLKDGDTLWSAISAPNDTDWFKISVNAGDTLKIGIDSLSSKMTNYTTLVCDDALTSLSWRSLTSSLATRVMATAGTYYVKFLSTSGQYSPKPYRITAFIKPKK